MSTSPMKANCSQRRRIAAPRSESVTWIRPGGELDCATAPQLDRWLRRAQLRARKVVLDLRDLRFIAGAGVHTILDAHERALRLRCDFAVVPGCDQVTRVLDLTGASDVLTLLAVDDAPRRGVT